MSFLCFWRFLIYLISLLFCIATTTTTAEKLYCITHKAPGVHTLKECTTLKERPISDAALAVEVNSATTTTTITNNNKITFDLTCNSDPTTCLGVSSTFQKATDIISTLFQFETPLLINASFINFCTEFNDCGYDGKMTSIGQAYPSISYVMVDKSDNMTRMYPQPLLKQFTTLSIQPAWTKYDINAQFNTQMNWYFVNDPNPINNVQTEFLKNVLHELIHGLGFITSWTDDLYRGLSPLFQENDLNRFITPSLLASINDNQLLDEYNTEQPFWGFVEFPFDKLLTYTPDDFSTTRINFTTTTRQLNSFSNSNTTFQTIIDFANSWYNSNEYQESIKIYQKSIRKLNVLANNELWLETSLNPYSTGSSLCHVDQSVYLNSTEYLMIYTAKQGVSIIQLNQQYPLGPVGPMLRQIMASLGYKLGNEYNTIRPNLSYWSPPPGLVGTSSNPSPSLSINTNGPATFPTSFSPASFTSSSSSSSSSSSLSSSSSTTTTTKTTTASSSVLTSTSSSTCIIILTSLLLFLFL